MYTGVSVGHGIDWIPRGKFFARVSDRAGVLRTDGGAADGRGEVLAANGRGCCRRRVNSDGTNADVA